MALDPSVILQAGRGVTPLMSQAEIQDQQMQREVGGMKLAQLRQGMQDDQTQREIARSTAPEGLAGAYYKAGLIKPAQDAQKFATDQQKAAADARKIQVDTGKTMIEAMGGPLKWLSENPSMENAAATFKHLNDAGIMKPEQVSSALQQLQSDPSPQGIAKFAQMGVQAAIKADEQAKMDVQKRGQDITMRGQDLTQGTTLRGQDLSRSTALRGQDMTDTRARDFNATKAEENKLKREQKQETADLTKAGQIASFDTMLGTLDRLTKHPGLEKSVGLRGKLPTIPGSESANFQAELDTFQSQAFIPMVAQLKGMGALSDAEGKRLTQAVGALNPNMGEKAFRESIKRITDDMNAARVRVAGTTKGAAPSAPMDLDPSSVEAEMRKRGLLK